MKNLYIIYDRIARAMVGLNMYTCFNFHTDQEAARYFADAIFDEKSILARHPADYDLRKIGTIDEQGNLIATDPFMNIITTGDALIAATTPKLVAEK